MHPKNSLLLAVIGIAVYIAYKKGLFTTTPPSSTPQPSTPQPSQTNVSPSGGNTGQGTQQNLSNVSQLESFLASEVGNFTNQASTALQSGAAFNLSSASDEDDSGDDFGD